MVPDEFVVVGRIGPARGVRGDVFVEPRTDALDERFAAGGVLRTEPASAGPLEIDAASDAGGKLVVHFRGVDDRPAAEALRGVTLCVPAAERPALTDPDEFYDTDLVGLVASTSNGVELGPVREVVHTGASTHLVIRVDGRDRLVPFVSAIVPSVDLAAGVVVVDPPEGLFDL
jgi:16S rRNA processing protein RimM